MFCMARAAETGLTSDGAESAITIWQEMLKLCQARQVSPLWSLTHNSNMLGTFEGAGSVLQAVGKTRL